MRVAIAHGCMGWRVLGELAGAHGMCVCGACARRLCELNVLRQVYNACLTPTVQGAWARGQPLAVHGLIYDPTSGHITVGLPPTAAFRCSLLTAYARAALIRLHDRVGKGRTRVHARFARMRICSPGVIGHHSGRPLCRTAGLQSWPGTS
jgi:hypothetical protein